MFYPVESLRRGGRFYLCWVADSWPLRFATITHRQLWSQDIRKICDDLLEVMTSESGRTKNRFSLRLSSQLMRGLVRFYQRKVTVFLGDLCMINAIVMKSTHKHMTHETSIHQELPRLVFEEHVDDDKIEERIQNSSNTVAHVQDITLKEPILPENKTLLDDNFGELNADQPLQMLVDRSVEMMLEQETSAIHHSGLDLPELSADKSHDRSRLVTHDARMERISEHDISVFRKSIGEGLVPGPDFEKEVPQIPDILPPDSPAPPENQREQLLVADDTVPLKPHVTNEKSKEKSLEEIVLEELEEEPQVKRRKLKTKLIVDKKTKLSSNFIRLRIANVNVELRCEDSARDVIQIFAPANVLLHRAARSELGRRLARMFAASAALARAHRDVEEVVARKTRQSHMRSILEKIDEQVEPTDKSIEPMQHEMQDISKEINVTDAQIQHELLVPAQGQEIMDISDLPTQRIQTISEAQIDDGPQAKRQCRSGYVSYRLSQRFAMEISNTETNKENIPVNVNQDAERLTAMLVEAGLADIQELERPPGVDTSRVTITGRRGNNGSDSSETPLGSLDRTKVSLGDSERTTDSKRFIGEEWGTQGTMYKIYRCIKQGVRPLDLRRLVARGPTVAGLRRVIAARCFTSMLKLKQHGFISITKDANTNEIKYIALGSKIIANKRQDDWAI